MVGPNISVFATSCAIPSCGGAHVYESPQALCGAHICIVYKLELGHECLSFYGGVHAISYGTSTWTYIPPHFLVGPHICPVRCGAHNASYRSHPPFYGKKNDHTRKYVDIHKWLQTNSSPAKRIFIKETWHYLVTTDSRAHQCAATRRCGIKFVMSSVWRGRFPARTIFISRE